MLKRLNFIKMLIVWIFKKFFHRSFVELKMVGVNSYNLSPLINNTYYEEYVFNILVNNNKDSLLVNKAKKQNNKRVKEKK
jgi:hypothetical protein